MPKIQKHIEIARSSIKRLSSMSQESCEALQTLLSEHYQEVSITTVNNFSDLKLLLSKKPDLVFLGLQYVYKNDVEDVLKPKKYWVSDFLASNDIAFTGSPKQAMMLEDNKSLSKQRVMDSGLNTSDFFVVDNSTELTESTIDIPYPLFVKPTSKGGGVGIDAESYVTNFAELESKVQSIRSKYGADALVERYLSGREFTVAVLKDINADNHIAMPLELVAPVNENGTSYLSQSVKSKDKEEFLEVTDLKLKKIVNELALDCFEALGARDYGRIDIRLDAKGAPQFLEANLIPSLIEGYGNFPKASLVNEDMDFESIILNIVDLAFLRESQSDTEPEIRTKKLVPSLA